MYCWFTDSVSSFKQAAGHTAESNGKESVANSDGKPAVTVTIPPYKFFVDKIAGDKVDVNVMVSNGNNPETYEPYAQQMMELSRSALYLKVEASVSNRPG